MRLGTPFGSERILMGGMTRDWRGIENGIAMRWNGMRMH
jgi:hypothetical protein